MDIMNGLTAISKALDIVRVLRDIESQSNDATFKMEVAELHSALADAKIALSDAKETISEKDKEIKSLKEIQSEKMRVVKYKGYNFGIDEEGSSIGRPFCPVCEQERGLQVQIVRASSNHDLCPKCHALYSSYPWQLPKEKIPSS